MLDLDQFKQDLTLELNKTILKQIRDEPTARILNLDRITVDEIKEYLYSLQTTSWSIFTIFGEPGDELAAKWFLRELGKFYDFQALKSASKLEPSGS